MFHSVLMSIRRAKTIAAAFALVLIGSVGAFAGPQEAPAGEASLKLPDLHQVQFLGVNGHNLLMIGILF